MIEGDDPAAAPRAANPERPDPAAAPGLARPAQRRSSDEPGPTSLTLTWEYDIPLVNNLFMLRDFLLVIVLSMIIMQLLVLLVGFLAGEGLVVLPLLVYGIVAGVVLVLYLVAAGLMFLNRYRMHFTVGPQGVAYEAGTRERRRNRVILVLSALLGRPGPALIATSKEAGSFAWREIAKVTVHPRQRVITLSNSWRPILRLYCTAGDYDEVAGLVQAYAAASAAKRAARPRLVSRRPWWVYLVWTLAVAAATFMGMVGYDTNLDDGWRWLLLSAALVLVAGLVAQPLVRRLCAFAGFVAGIFVLIYLLRDALRPIIGPSGFFYGRFYEVDTWMYVVSLIGQLALLGMAAWRLFGKAPLLGS